jgi:clan AA aspartic protease (TIGR02281 family)
MQVGLGSGIVRMMLDTGATSSVIPQDVADSLLRRGEAHLWGYGTGTLADGRTVSQMVIMIDRVVVGSHVLTNVKASVSPLGGSALLGLDVVSSFGKFSIDKAAAELVFG